MKRRSNTIRENAGCCGTEYAWWNVTSHRLSDMLPTDCRKSLNDAAWLSELLRVGSGELRAGACNPRVTGVAAHSQAAGARKGEPCATPAEDVGGSQYQTRDGAFRRDGGGLSTRTLRSIARSSTWAASYLRLSSAAFITIIAESDFRIAKASRQISRIL